MFLLICFVAFVQPLHLLGLFDLFKALILLPFLDYWDCVSSWWGYPSCDISHNAVRPSVLSHGKVKAVPLSPSFEGGSSLWRIVSCANTLRCLTWLRQPQSTSGYCCWSFSTLYQSSLISHPITIVSVVIHFLVVYDDNIWSLLQKAIFHTKIIKVRYVWKVGILM